MIKVFIAALFLTVTAHAQDTIELKEVRVDKKYKKPKLKTFLFGDKKTAICDGLIFQLQDTYFYLIETHYGEIKEISLNFLMFPNKPKDEKHFKAVAERTEYDITIYRNDNGLPGNAVNVTPIRITCEAGRHWKYDIPIDVSGYGITDSAFFIKMTSLTPPEDDKCYYFPKCFKTETNKHIYVYNKAGVLTRHGRNMGLMVNVKVLTQDY